MEKIILLVDDNPDISEMVAIRLESSGYKVICALNGNEALRRAQEDHPDIILLDIAMPEMDGFEVGRRLKQNPETCDIPIIMVTAKGSHKDILRAITQAGAKDYIIKPFSPEALSNKLKEIFRKLQNKRPN